MLTARQTVNISKNYIQKFNVYNVASVTICSNWSFGESSRKLAEIAYTGCAKKRKTFYYINKIANS